MSCEYCGGQLTHLGRLGSVDYARCEACGADWMVRPGELALADEADAAMLDEEMGRRA